MFSRYFAFRSAYSRVGQTYKLLIFDDRTFLIKKLLLLSCKRRRTWYICKFVASHFAEAKSCWHGQCFSRGSDFSRGVFYDVLLRRLTTWRVEELPTLASPCKGRGEWGARRVQITRRLLQGLLVRQVSRTRSS